MLRCADASYDLHRRRALPQTLHGDPLAGPAPPRRLPPFRIGNHSKKTPSASFFMPRHPLHHFNASYFHPNNSSNIYLKHSQNHSLLFYFSAPCFYQIARFLIQIKPSILTLSCRFAIMRRNSRPCVSTSLNLINVAIEMVFFPSEIHTPITI
ncbi:hypothetical protein [Chromobacterium violaceum]|uniref:hypothetical protein n=1 Tax=Chromobacterium violaceum TaxID=536 RepID=UPI00111C4EA5|nr:hypothetical protein [Chromobacterium violaceum]QRO32879.1 hypothetical protein I6K04_20800 [Chromobacterium violaceum]QRQ17320.1 hypothetical protein I6K03_01925 [Chromobacterium violaceum]